MNRNQLFETVTPDVRVGRTKFDLSERRLTTFNEGSLIPIYVNADILPGDTFDVTTKFKLRTRTPLAPVLDNCKLDTYWFFVPDRLTWKHTKEFYGDSNPSAWIAPQTYVVPHVDLDDLDSDDLENGLCGVGTLWDYMGLPLLGKSETSDMPIPIQVLPFRAYKLIWNTWFRDENLMDPVLVSDSDTGTTNDFIGDTTVLDTNKRFKPLRASRIHDLFSSCLPSTQKGPQIYVPLLGNAPVVTMPVDNTKLGTSSLRVRLGSEGPLSMTNCYQPYIKGSTNVYPNAQGLLLADQDPDHVVAESGLNLTSVIPSNLVVDLSEISAVSVSNLRLAVASQRILERMARGGSRFEEFLRAFFGIVSPEAVLQIPQYLGGQTAIIQNNQVIQTSASSEDGDLGQTAAFSLTIDSKKSFVHSFTEPGVLLCLAVARVDRTYEQNIRRMWTRTSFFDRYTPPLAHLSEQPIFKYELSVIPGSDKEQEVFGYNEAWVHYRFGMNTVTGEMRPSANNGSMRHWSYTDYYQSLPSLSAGWMKEGDENVDQTLAVQSELSDQFFGDFFFEIYATRPLPPRSVPGLMDHF